MNDEEIVALFWGRSERAIEETERVYGRYFRSVARGILGDDGDAEETVNDLYLKAWNQIPPERPNCLKAFLGRMLRQLSLNRLERNMAQKRGANRLTAVLDELEECVPAAAEGSLSMADSVALRDAMNRFLRSLPAEPRRVFIRRYWHMKAVSDIAAELSASESKIKSMLMRTRGKLKTYLEQEGFIV